MVQEPFVRAAGTGTGHQVYDFVMGTVVVALAFFRSVEFLRTYGVIPERNGGLKNNKPIGRMRIESLQSIVRHEVANLLNPMMVQLQMAQKEETEILQDIKMGILEVATILRERK